MTKITEEQKKAELEKLVGAHNDLLEFVQTERGQKRFQQYLEGLAGLDEFGKLSVEFAQQDNLRGSIRVLIDMKIMVDIMAQPYAHELMIPTKNALKLFQYAQKRLNSYIDAVDSLDEGAVSS